MGLFVCDSCNCVENTALGYFWGRGESKALCSACGGREWHNKFPRETYDPAIHPEVRNRGARYFRANCPAEDRI